MGLYCGISLSDCGFIEATEVYGIAPDYSAGTDQFIQTFLQVARSTVPVDTGYLRSTISANGDDMNIECFADADYAEYVEYGTWRCPAQPYFEPAIQEAFDEALPLWEEAEEWALQEEQELIEQEQEEQARTSASGGGGGNGFFGSLGAMIGMMIALAVVTLVREFFSSITDGRSSGGSLRGGEAGGHFANYDIEII